MGQWAIFAETFEILSMTEKTKYELRGVSAAKTEVHEAIKGLSKGIFPNAFCKVLPDIVGGDDAYCNIMHADTAGTKTSLAYMCWKETGDVGVWKGIVQDAIVMNVDDMACVGCTDNIVLSSTIGRNKNLITGEVIKTIIREANAFCDRMSEYGVGIHPAGGETADVGDIVRSIDVGYTTFARIKKDRVLENDIQPGNVIVGFASFGQATYESKYNSGIGSNGLTSARHDVLSSYHAEAYPDSFNPLTPSSVRYTGTKKFTDVVSFDGVEYTVADLLLSPTRTYLPLLKRVFDDHLASLNGVIHCTGGAQTKVLHFADNVHIIKDNLFPMPPVFQLIQQESGTDLKEMYEVFNMGHRLEIYTDEVTAKALIALAGEFDIAAQVIGRVEAAEGKKLTIQHSADVAVSF